MSDPFRIRPSDITPEATYLNRRALLAGLAGGGLVASVPAVAQQVMKVSLVERLRYTRSVLYSTDEKPNTLGEISGYNNFYEFGTDKDSPAEHAHRLRTRPWSVVIDGECEKPGTLAIEDLMQPHALEERIYRLRCVEAWSMVIPWVGIPLADVVKRFAPTSRAKYVEFTTLHDPKQMPGQRFGVLDWPYVEGLRIDEATHPLAILAVGLYGRVLPNQNGAPLRLVVPWKYGFKSIKSIVRMRFTERMPATSWALSAPREYGFFANVNPDVDHPRWSQKSERRIGSANPFARIPTQMFNGYEREVAGLYRGMNLARNF